MRKRLALAVEAVAGFVYDIGVRLFSLSDHLKGWDEEAESDETDLTESQVAGMWLAAEPTTTAGHNAKVTYTISGTSPPPPVSP